jgi:peptidoglycan/xylan/chitin deacetylase (PgdA/CDA1 family)
MPIAKLRNAIIETKIRFSIAVAALSVLIVFGSFYLVDSLRYSSLRVSLFVTSLQYRAEYIAENEHISLLAAVGSTVSSSMPLEVSEGRALGVPVLTYHSVIPGKDDSSPEATISSFEGANVSLERFKEQMFALKRAGWQAVSYDDFDAFIHGKKELPEKSFLLTFDDGAKNSFYPVDPLLAALNFRATTFILPAHSLGERSTYYLNKGDLGLLKSTGRFDIESHGLNIHQSLPVNADGSVKDNALSNRIWLEEEGRLETHEEYAKRIGDDLALSKQELERALGITVSGFAFPFGDYGQNAGNDKEGQATILAAARKNYSLAFFQNWNKDNFTFNYPNPEAFLVKRIPVNPSWSGAELIAVLDAASPKPLPYRADAALGEGWVQDWGEAQDTRNGEIRISASPNTTGALVMLDGSYPWKNYKVEMEVEWDEGFMMLLFDMQSASQGRACVFSSDGNVQLQGRTGNDILILRETKKKEVKAGLHRIGAVTAGTTTACLFDGTYVIDATLPPASGGVGVEAWQPAPGVASAYIRSIKAEKMNE